MEGAHIGHFTDPDSSSSSRKKKPRQKRRKMPGRGRAREQQQPPPPQPESPPRCCVPGCQRWGPAAGLRPLPQSPGPRQRWLQAIVGRRPEGERRRCSLELGRIRKPVICADHFKPGEVVTPDTLPSVFTPRRPGARPGEMSPGVGAAGGPASPSCSTGLGAGLAMTTRAAEEPEDRDAPPRPGEGSRGRIGDLVLAAELMEMVSETVQHVQKEARFEQAFGHDHGAYVIPDDTPTLKKMVKEMKDTIHAQNGRLTALQRELASTLAQYKELKERYESERWSLSLELGAKITELQMQNATLRCEREGLERQLRKVQEQLDSTAGTVLFLSQQMKEKESKVKEAAFSVENMRPGRKWVRFYTGFENYEKFEAFLHFVTQDASLCSGKIRGHIARGRLDAGPHSTLSHADQLLLVMCRLRLGLLLQDLAYRFKISETTVSRVWLNWTEVIQARLMQIPVMCSPKYVEVFQPKRTIQHRGRPLTMLDCTDLFFEVQAKERSRPDSTQPYRNHYVRRGYALASPNGYMTFASSLAFGITARGSEEGLLEEEEMMEEDDEDEEGGEERAAEEEESRDNLKLPEFFHDGALTEEQRGLTRQMLSVRSHVDKVLNFRFLKYIYPRTMEAQVDRAWTICSYLACLLHEPMGLR